MAITAESNLLHEVAAVLDLGFIGRFLCGGVGSIQKN
jgi:hypothetical protein